MFKVAKLSAYFSLQPCNLTSKTPVLQGFLRYSKIAKLTIQNAKPFYSANKKSLPVNHHPCLSQASLKENRQAFFQSLIRRSVHAVHNPHRFSFHHIRRMEISADCNLHSFVAKTPLDLLQVHTIFIQLRSMCVP